MKIGDAGEAFFVFETEGDIPEDLITSPILEATEPEEAHSDIQTGRFGGKADEQGEIPEANHSPETEERKRLQVG